FSFPVSLCLCFTTIYIISMMNLPYQLIEGVISSMPTNVTSGSITNRRKIQHHLRNFNFKALFVEELGWSILKEPPLAIIVEGTRYALQPLVEKRGVKVFVCDPDTRGHIPPDGLLRKIEREVTRHAAYEHLII